MSKPDTFSRVPNSYPKETIILTADDPGLTFVSDENEEEYPSCALHPAYFELALQQLAEGRSNCALSIESWDNREILQVFRKQ